MGERSVARTKCGIASFVAPVPEVVLAQEMMPEADAPIARAERQGMLERRLHFLKGPSGMDMAV